MKVVIDVIYKNLDERQGGSFTNDKGLEITYKASYVLICDIANENKHNEIKLKFSKDNNKLAEDLRKLAPYTQARLVCNLELSNSNAKVIPISLDSK